MNKSDLVKTLAGAMELTHRKSEEIVDAVFALMTNTLRSGNRIEIRGFGSFLVKEYEPYLGRNPKTGEKIQVQGKRLPFFKAGKDLRGKVDD